MERLKELRLKNNLLQKDVAEKLGINRTTYVKYETGVTEPDFRTLVLLAELFGTTTDYLLGKDCDPIPSTEDQELLDYLDELKNRSEMRMLFSLAKGATKKDVEQAVAIIEALRKNENG